MLPVWMLNKWTLRGAGLALVVAAIMFWGWQQKREGREEGEASASQEAKESIEQMKQADRAATQEQLDGLRELIDQYKQAFEQSQQRQVQLAQANALLSQRRQETSESVNRIADSELHSYIVAQLGLRPVGDRSPGYSFAEERELAKCVSDKPLCDQQVAKQKEEIAELQQGQRTLQGEVRTQQQRFDVLATYTDRLEGHYTVIYNLFPKKKRGWKCLGLWKCAKVTLPTPEPITLVNPAKQGATP